MHGSMLQAGQRTHQHDVELWVAACAGLRHEVAKGREPTVQSAPRGNPVKLGIAGLLAEELQAGVIVVDERKPRLQLRRKQVERHDEIAGIVEPADPRLLKLEMQGHPQPAVAGWLSVP